MELFGPDFEAYVPESEDKIPHSATAKDAPPAAVDKAKKGKLLAKATGHTFQFQILESIGVPRSEIKKFADPIHWTKYFPPIAKVDDIPFTLPYAETLTKPRQTITRLVHA
jgi:leucyl-tRNA synthetase